MKAPIAQLLQQAVKAEKALTSAQLQHKRNADKLEAEKRKEAKGKPVAKAASTPALFDQGAASATRLPVYSQEEAKKLTTLRAPVVVQASSIIKEIFKEGCAAADLKEDFSASFKVATHDDPAARGSRRVPPGDGGRAFADAVHQCFPQISFKVPTAPELEAMFSTTVFGIGRSYDKVTAEHCGAAAARLTLEGSRSVVATSAQHLLSFMGRKGVTGHISQGRMFAFMRSMQPAMLAEYAKQCSMWSGTVGPGDMIITPYGFVVGELVSEATMGLRVSLAPSRNADEAAVSALAKRIEDLAGQPSSRALSHLCVTQRSCLFFWPAA